jgi:hypothetical protein
LGGLEHLAYMTRLMMTSASARAVAAPGVEPEE